MAIKFGANVLSIVSGWVGGLFTQKSGKQDTAGGSGSRKAPAASIDSALRVSAFWAAIEVLVDNISSLPLFVYENTKTGRVLARGQQLYRLLHTSPNPRHTAMEFWSFMVWHFVIYGNAYARLERNNKGEVIAMWPLSSTQVAVEVLKTGQIVYAYSFDSKVEVYASSSILHLRDKGNGIVGFSRLNYMSRAINVATQTNDLLYDLYSNQTKRPMKVMFDAVLTQQQRADFREKYKGLAEEGNESLLLLEGGTTAEELGMTPIEAKLFESLVFGVEDIARFIGVPSIFINDLSNRVPYGNNGELAEFFYKFRLRPMLVNFEQALALRVLTTEQRINYTVEFNLDGLLRGSLKERVEIMAKQTQNGLKTSDECRQLENDPPQPGGNVLRAQSNLVPLELLGKTTGKKNVTHQNTINQ